MKVRVHLTAFPVFSETFVLNQITGLVECGHDVVIEVDRIGDTRVVHPDVARLSLMDRVSLSGDAYGPMPRNKLHRLARAIKLYVRARPEVRRVLWRCLDRRRFGRDALTLNLFYRAAQAMASSADRVGEVSLCHFGPMGERVARLRTVGATSRPVVAVFHGHDLSRDLLDGPMPYGHLFAEAALLLPVSRHWCRKLVSLGADPTRLAVHHMGVDTDDFVSAGGTEAHGRLASGPVRLLSIARLVEKKGLLPAVEAVEQLLSSGVELRYRIVGSGPLEAALRERIASSCKPDAWTLDEPLTGPEIRDALSAADLFLLPSVTASDGDQEGIPVVLMEAMATGLPVVSTWHSGIPELVEHGVSGWLVPERDTAMLAAAINQLRVDPATRVRMGAAARRRIVDEFDIRTLNDCLIERLLAVLHHSG